MDGPAPPDKRRAHPEGRGEPGETGAGPRGATARGDSAHDSRGRRRLSAHFLEQVGSRLQPPAPPQSGVGQGSPASRAWRPRGSSGREPAGSGALSGVDTRAHCLPRASSGRRADLRDPARGVWVAGVRAAPASASSPLAPSPAGLTLERLFCVVSLTMSLWLAVRVTVPESCRDACSPEA